jgi:hypothetical protein
VREALPPRVSLRDLGEYRLPDLLHPERVYQLVSPGVAPNFPALHSLDAVPHNLPVQLTSFVGRERQMDEVARLLTSRRSWTSWRPAARGGPSPLNWVTGARPIGGCGPGRRQACGSRSGRSYRSTRRESAGGGQGVRRATGRATFGCHQRRAPSAGGSPPPMHASSSGIFIPQLRITRRPYPSQGGTRRTHLRWHVGSTLASL